MYCIKYNSGYFAGYVIRDFKIVPHFVSFSQYFLPLKMYVYPDEISMEEELENLLKQFNIVGVKTLLIEQNI